MKLITELNENVTVITEAVDESGEKSYYIEGVFMQSEVTNRNGRSYPKDILVNETNRYIKENVEKKRAYGELGHPNSPTINLDRVSHLITSLRVEGNDIIGKAKIMDTPNGKIVKELMKEGASLGVSSRGMGSLKAKRGINEVQGDFYLATPADIVADPSAPNAFVNGIMEGVEFYFDESRGIIAEKIAGEIEDLASKNQLTEENQFRLMEKFIKSL